MGSFRMKKIIILTLILASILLSACSLEGESPNWDHLQNNDPSKLNRNTNELPSPTTNENMTDDPRCIEQYTTDDIINRDLELRAKIEQDINLCYQMEDEPLIVSCPNKPTLVYYSKTRCLEMFSE